MLKKRGGFIACIVFTLFMVWLGHERMADEIKKNEELKKQEQREASQIAKDYVVEYTNRLQSAMAIAPFSDLKVKYRKVTRSVYLYGKENEEQDDYWMDRNKYHYYYLIEYVSDSADEVYEQLTAGGDYSEYIDLMNQLRRARVEVENEYQIWNTYETKINNTVLIVDINDKIFSNDMVIKGTDGRQYELSQGLYGQYIFVDKEQVFGREREASELRRSSSRSHKSSSYSSDPYDTSDYDNPDDFADDWAEEFGDGDYDDGYDDAYDYWENNKK